MAERPGQVPARRCRSGPSCGPGSDEFLIDGRAPRAGEVFRQPGQADTLDELARQPSQLLSRRAGQGHRRPRRAQAATCARRTWPATSAKWVEPISLDYRGYDVWEIPPSGQGLIALMTLNILKGFEFGERDCARGPGIANWRR
ncbi:gamma-glutamyltransferase [Pseudomonas aeruginosa]